MPELVGYTGVVQGTEMVGYTSADGYTAVVASGVTSGHTGTTPVTAATRQATHSRSVTTPPVPGSAYDQAIGTDATSVGPSSAARPFDLDEVREIEEADLDDEPAEQGRQPNLEASTAATADRDGEATAGAIARLVDRLVDLERHARLSPQPTNSALEEAWRALTGPPTEAPFGGQHPVHLIGELATAGFDRQLEAALAASPPSNLGVAYLQGIGQAVITGLVSASSGIVSTQVDPIGAALNQAWSLVDEIETRVEQGQSLLTAVNGVLNPITRAAAAWNAADAAAGAALDAAAMGDWLEAVKLSRAAGRQAAGFSAAVVDTATTAAGWTKQVAERGRLRLKAQRRAPEPPTPPAPIPSGMGTTTTTTVPATPKSQPSPPAASTKPGQAQVPLSTPHPVWAKVPVVNPAKLASLLTYNKALYAGQLQAARQRLLGLTGRRRKRQRAAAMKAVYNTQERLDALEQQRRHPDRAYLYDVKVKGVETPAGLVRPRQIPGMRAADPDAPGRIFDVYEMRPDGTHRPRELKSVTTTIDSVPKSGGVTVAFNRGSQLGKQLGKTNALQDFATKTGGKIRLTGKALDGSDVELLMDPNTMSSTIVSDYGAFVQ